MVTKEQGISAANLIDSLNYYTPSIKDIYIGYKCELEENGKWYPHIITGYDSENNLIQTDTVSFYYNNNLRTPYLTKEQIETEGWKIKTEYTGKFRFVFEKGNSWLAWNPEENMMTIMPIDPSKEFYGHSVRYAGGCPSINEFRTICKLLSI